MKLLHPVFGKQHRTLFKILYILFLVDTFILQTAVQMIVLLVLLVILFLWDHITKTKSRVQSVLVRFLQALLGLQALVSFVVQMPGVLDSWQEKH